MRSYLMRSTGPAGRLIQLRLQEHWNHGVIQAADRSDLILDSTLQHGGVRARPMHDALRNVSAVLELDVPLPKEEAAMRFAWECVEARLPYDIEALWGFTVGSRHWHSSLAYYCYEFIASCWKVGGIPDFDGLRMVTAEDLINVAMKYGQVNRCRLSPVHLETLRVPA